MKALHVIPSLAPIHGGPSKVLPLMAKSLAQEGVDITIATTDDAGPGARISPSDSIQGASECSTYKIVHFPKQFEFYKVSVPFWKWIKVNIREFDILHVHALFSYTSTVAAQMARRASVPYIIRPLGVLNSYGVTERRKCLKSLSIRWIERQLIEGAATMHFTSEAERKEAEALGIPMRSQIIPLGIPAPAFVDRSYETSDPVKPYVLFLSRIDPKKNVESLLKAWASIRPEIRGGWNLRIAGTGEDAYVASLKLLASELRITDEVTWEGFVEGENKLRLLQNAQIFTLPSFSENFGVAAVEAMAAGLPSIIGEGVAVGAEAASHGACLATKPSPEWVSQDLIKLISDKTLRSSLGQAAKEFASDNYSLEKMGKSIAGLYREIVSNRS